MTVLVTGATGFLGRAVLARLRAEHIVLRAATRTPVLAPEGAESVAVGDIGPDTDWDAALRNTDVVVHTAARVHVMKDPSPRPLDAFRRVNVAGTERLAAAAARAGARRFVFVSSIKVQGESSADHPLREEDPARPADPYSMSKFEAEEALHAIAAATGLETVVLRPPLMYGAGVKGNFLALLKAVRAGVPLPLAQVRNMRSFLYVGNLADAIAHCIGAPAAAGRTYHVTDGEDLAAPELVRRIAAAMGRPARLFPAPLALLRTAGRLTGRQEAIARLTESLQVDASRIRTELGWHPPFPVNTGLAETVRWFLGSEHGKATGT